MLHFLFIDNGNTALKGLLTDANFGPVYSFSVKLDEFETLKQPLHAFGKIAGGFYASVGHLPDDFKQMLETEFALLPFSASLRLPIQLNYQTPETLGVDRLATAIGAHSLYPSQPVLVLDFGTCLKFDFVSAAGVYEGGSISPGLFMRYKAMHTFTAKLPLLSMPEKFPDHLLGRSTAESMHNGVLLGIVAEAEGMIQLYREIYPGLVVLITGGDAEVFEGRLKNSIFVRQNLALLGLAETKKYHADTLNEL